MNQFDKKCLIEVMLYILNATKGTDIYHVLKILYFAEQKHLVKWGSRITADNFRAYEYGPVADQLYHAIRNSRKLDKDLPDMLRQVVYFAGDDAPNVLLARRNADLDYLSKSEIECLDEAIKENANLTFDELKQKSHDTAWQEAYQGEDDLMSAVSIAKAAGANEAMIEYIVDQSFVDCLQIKTAPLAKLSSGRYKGKIDAEDTELIKGTLKNSPREKAARLRKFGIK